MKTGGRTHNCSHTRSSQMSALATPRCPIVEGTPTLSPFLHFRKPETPWREHFNECVIVDTGISETPTIASFDVTAIGN